MSWTNWNNGLWKKKSLLLSPGWWSPNHSIAIRASIQLENFLTCHLIKHLDCKQWGLVHMWGCLWTSASSDFPPSSRRSCWDTKGTISQEKILDIMFRIRSKWSEEWLCCSFGLFWCRKERLQKPLVSAQRQLRFDAMREETTPGWWDSQGYIINSQMCLTWHRP